MKSPCRFSRAGFMIGALCAIACLDANRAHGQSESSSQRQPISRASTADLSRLSITELLALQPADANDAEALAHTAQAKIAELTRRAESHTMSDADWRAALSASDVVHTRSRWLAGTPLNVWIREPMWLAHSSIRVRAVQPALGQVVADNLHPSWCGVGDMMVRDAQRSLALEKLPANTSSVVFEITIDHIARSKDADDDPFASAKRLWKGSMEIPITAVATLDDVIPVTSDPAVTSAVRESVHAWWGKNGSDLCIGIGGPLERFTALRGVGVSLRLELCHDGEVVRRDRVDVSSIDWSGQPPEARGYVTLERLPEDLTAHRRQLRGWELRLTGTSERVLTLWEANRWWNGTVAVPLDKALASTDPK